MTTPTKTKTTTMTTIMTTECNTCPACQTRREVSRPAETVEGYIPWDTFYDAQDAAAELDCHCDHATCSSLADGHDTDECEWCLHRHDPDEDTHRDR